MSEFDPIKEADERRIGDAAVATLAAADEQRMLATRRETELNRIAGDLPDDPTALWSYAEYSITQATVSSIDAGRALIKLKVVLPYGEFGPALAERGISTSAASNMMKIAAKFSMRVEKFQKITRTKLLACLEFSNDELDALEDGQSILDITLDDLDRMTTRELKAAIKKRDADLDVKDQLLESKNKQIDGVAEENARLRGHTSESDVSPFIQELESEKAQILIPMMRLKNRALMLEARFNDKGEVDRAEYFALQAALDVLRDEMAQAMDACYNSGTLFQMAIANASMASDLT